MALTVTATSSGSSAQRGLYLLVKVLTGATEPGGASGGGSNAAASTPSGSLTPNGSNSWVAFSLSADAAGTMSAAAANNTYDSSNDDVTDNWCSAEGHYTGTVTSGTALTYGAGSTPAGSDHSNWCAYEVLASGGTTPAVDASSPALASTETGTGGVSVTTASFSPPVGAVLVAMIAAGGSGTGTGITMTVSGGGLAWTQRAVSNSSDNFQPTFIWTATVPATGAQLLHVSVAQTSRTWQRRWTRTVRPNIPPLVQQVTVHAGVAAVSAQAVFPAGFRPFIYALAGSGYNAWFTDRAGNPKLQLSEQAWALPWNAGRWNSGNWQSDYDTYFQTRSAQGYNSWYGVMWGNSHVDSTALSGGRTWDGIYPLNINGTPGAIATGAETVTLNNSFWTRIDYFINSAMANGVTVFLNLSMSYDVTDAGGIWQHASTTQATAAGNALATRYAQANYPNLQWFFGDDDDATDNTLYQAFLTGIQNAGDTRGLISKEQLTNTNCHIEFDTKTAFGGTFGPNNATYNWVYSYDPTYLGVEDSYSEGGTFTHIPATYGDGTYYGDTGSGTVPDRVMRTFAWWALASGARGIAATSGPSALGGGGLWTWQSGAVGRLTTDPNGNGTWCTSDAGRIRAYFESLTDFQKLIPDTGNVFITAGRGTRGTSSAPGGTFNFGNTDNYVAGSITPAGTLAVIYCKAAMSITIDQTKMGAGYTATWVDPLSLATTSTATGSTYSSSGLGNNSAGDPDWVLVLQGPPVTTATAGAAAVSVAANQPVVAVTVTAGVAAVAAAAPGATAAVAPAAAAAAVLAVAPAASVAETVTAGVGVINVAAPGVTAVEGVTAGVGIVLVADPGATVSTSGGTTANAGVATVSVVANAPAIAEGVTAGVAAVSVVATQAIAAVVVFAGVAAVAVTAPAASVAEAVTAGVSTVLAVAPAATVAETVFPGAGVINAADPGATVNTSGSTTAVAGPAAVAALAMGPAPAIVVSAGVAAVAAAGLAATASFGNTAIAGVAAVAAVAKAPASLAVAVAAGAAAIGATATNVPPQFTVGQLGATSAAASATLTASSARQGTLSATASP